MTPVSRPGPSRLAGPAAVAAFLAFVLVLMAVTADALGGLFAQRTALSETEEMLERLRERRAPAGGGMDAVGAPEGSPFLEGPSANVAAAALVQRIAAAVERASGRLTSSQVDLDGSEPGDGYLRVSVTVEIEQAGLAGMLHDIEAGMPFLFVEALDLQTTERGERDGDGTPMRAQLTLAGRWEGAK
ncbi:type II secretion system protein GspM [Terrihabitans sp. B22-R8]|uniref:type II secretion system protein GspM n=1 Tax=Terrihabitans sp. B22-R8 TaxID=3425128 RepID=UPI00403D54AE